MTQKNLFCLDKTQQKTVPKAYVSRFVNLLLSLFGEAAKNWLRFSEYFQLFYRIAEFGEPFRKLLIQRKVIALFGDLFLGPHSPHANKNKRQSTLGSKLVPPDFQYLFKTLSLLICSCSTESTQQFGNPPTQLPGEVIPCAEADKMVRY